MMDLGLERRSELIGEKGQAFFPATPANFRGQPVHMWVESADFESLGSGQQLPLDRAGLYLAVKRKSGRISGLVQDGEGNPVAGAVVSVAGFSTTTDALGHFNFTIPGDLLSEELNLQAVATGYASAWLKVVPGSNEAVVQLRRSP